MQIKNSKAFHDYTILEKFELGIVLNGCEVKSIRDGRASIKNAHLSYKDPHIMIMNMHIDSWYKSDAAKYDTTRARIMLLRKNEKNKMIAALKLAGQTIVPLELFWNKKGMAKLVCAIVVGKTNYDKRASIKEREFKRTKEILFKNRKLGA